MRSPSRAASALRRRGSGKSSETTRRQVLLGCATGRVGAGRDEGQGRLVARSGLAQDLSKADHAPASLPQALYQTRLENREPINRHTRTRHCQY